MDFNLKQTNKKKYSIKSLVIMNAYILLGVENNATQEEIKHNYHRLLLQVHPDKNIESSNYDLGAFLRLRSAYQILSNPTSRINYDSLLRQTELISDSSVTEEECLFNLNRDFEFSPSEEIYRRTCRCWGSQTIRRQDLDLIFKQQTEISESDAFILALECDTCSLIVNVLII